MSNYHFLNTLISLKGRVSLSIFAQHFMLEKVESYLKDLLVWWEHCHDDNLLMLFFDDLKEDHEGCVRRIAMFMSIKCDDNIIARVRFHTTTHAEMARHHSNLVCADLPQLLLRSLEKALHLKVNQLVEYAGLVGGQVMGSSISQMKSNSALIRCGRRL